MTIGFQILWQYVATFITNKNLDVQVTITGVDSSLLREACQHVTASNQ